MIAQQVRLKIVGWDDPAFRSTVENVVDSVRQAGLDLDSVDGLLAAETTLRLAGYPEATIRDRRTIDDVMAMTTSWEVRRLP